MEAKKLDTVLEISKFNKSLEKLYKILAQLEIDNKIQTKEYQDYLGLVEYVTDKIRFLIIKADLNAEETLELQELICALNNYEKNDYLYQAMFNTENKVLKLSMEIYNWVMEKHLVVTEDYDIPEEYDDSDLKDYDETDLKEKYDDFASQYEDNMYKIEAEQDHLDSLVDSLFANTLLEYLNEEIQKENNNELKAELIKVKYALIYLDKSLEINLLKQKKPVAIPYLYQELIHLELKEIHQEEDYEDIEEIEELDTKNAVETAKLMVDEINELANQKNKSKKKLLELKLKTLYIKSLLSVQRSKEVIDEISKYIDLLKKENPANQQLNEIQSLKKELILSKNVD